MRATQWFFTTHVTASLRHHKPFKLRHNLSEQPVRSCHYPFPYRLASWFAVRPAPPAALHPLTFPSRQADWASKRMFFPQHLLYRYLTRSYRIRIPFGDWAGLHRWTHSCGKPHKRALVCRHHSFGPITRLILKRLCPQNQYSMVHSTCCEPVTGGSGGTRTRTPIARPPVFETVAARPTRLTLPNCNRKCEYGGR